MPNPHCHLQRLTILLLLLQHVQLFYPTFHDVLM